MTYKDEALSHYGIKTAGKTYWVCKAVGNQLHFVGEAHIGDILKKEPEGVCNSIEAASKALENDHKRIRSTLMKHTKGLKNPSLIEDVVVEEQMIRGFAVERSFIFFLSGHRGKGEPERVGEAIDAVERALSSAGVKLVGTIKL